MYKELGLFLIIVIFSSCSVFKSQNVNNIGDKETTNTRDLQNRNLTNNSFYIQKADVEVVSENEKNSFLVSVKFCRPDSFLISIRSKSGIEAARVFITEDTVLINDRINRKLYFGSANDLRKKFGYSYKLLPVLFGDFILNRDSVKRNEKCQKEIFIINSNYEGYRLKYTIDCRSDRLNKIEISDELNTKPVILNNFETRKYSSVYYYSRVDINDFGGFNYLSVNIKKIESPYKEYIDFVPGKNYEPVRIR